MQQLKRQMNLLLAVVMVQVECSRLMKEDLSSPFIVPSKPTHLNAQSTLSLALCPGLRSCHSSPQKKVRNMEEYIKKVLLPGPGSNTHLFHYAASKDGIFSSAHFIYGHGDGQGRIFWRVSERLQKTTNSS